MKLVGRLYCWHQAPLDTSARHTDASRTVNGTFLGGNQSRPSGNTDYDDYATTCNFLGVTVTQSSQPTHIVPTVPVTIFVLQQLCLLSYYMFLSGNWPVPFGKLVHSTPVWLILRAAVMVTQSSQPTHTRTCKRALQFFSGLLAPRLVAGEQQSVGVDVGQDLGVRPPQLRHQREHEAEAVPERKGRHVSDLVIQNWQYCLQYSSVSYFPS